MNFGSHGGSPSLSRVRAHWIFSIADCGRIRIAIYVLMQGKVRAGLDGRSERLEMEDRSQRLQRGSGVQVFEDYLLVYRPEKAAEERAVSAAV